MDAAPSSSKLSSSSIHHPLFIITIPTSSGFHVRCLVDSGATANFISSSFVSLHHIPTVTLPQYQLIRLADDSTHKTNLIVDNLTLFIHSIPIQTSFLLFPDLSYDIILGMSFLKQYNPIIDWQVLSLTFPNQSLPILPPLSSRSETSPITGSLTLIHSTSHPSLSIPTIDHTYIDSTATSTSTPISSVMHVLAPIKIKGKTKKLKDEPTEEEYIEMEKENKKLIEEQNKQFEVKRSSLKAAEQAPFNGLFSKVHFKPKSRLLQYTGEKLIRGINSFPEDETYLAKVTTNHYIDATDPSISSLARYANTIKNLSHSPSGSQKVNCTLRKGKNNTLWLWSNREHINPGDELFVSYGRRKSKDIITPEPATTTTTSTATSTTLPSPPPPIPKPIISPFQSKRTAKHKIHSSISVLSSISKPDIDTFSSSHTSNHSAPTPISLRHPIELCHLSPSKIKQYKRRGDGLFLILVREDKNGEPIIEINLADSTSTSIPLSAEEKELQQIRSKILKEYPDVFPASLPPGLPPKRSVEHEIELEPGAKPSFQPHRRMSPLDLDELRVHLKELVELGHIRPSSSPYGSPVLFAKKAGEVKRRLCIDYRDLNSKTIKNRYPIPKIEELIDRLQGARYITKLDLASGYHQIRMRTTDIEKTCFTTRYGNFEFLVMPFGLTNAPSTFMMMINNVLHPYTDEFVLAYLDDLLIYSKTLQEHQKHVRLVLDKLRSEKLYCKISKCMLVQQEVPFVGYIIGKSGIRVDPKKVEAVKNWKQPTTLTETRAFLGFVGFYRKFINNHSKVVSPITDLVKTVNNPYPKFTWTEKATEAFLKIKEMLCNAPVLAIADPKLPYTLQTDSSGYSVGAVLMQDQGKGLQPIAYFSKKLNEHEIKYPIHQQELAAIIYALKAWEHYLLGSKFSIKVLTDHRSLIHINKQKKLVGRQVRWSEYISRFGNNLQIEYITGKSNVVADALSRLPGDNDNPLVLTSPIEPTDITSSSSASGKHPISELLTLHSSSITSSLSTDIINAYSNDPITVKIIQKPTKPFTIHNSLIIKQNRIYIPNDSALKEKIMYEHHDSKLAGHMGVTKTIHSIQSQFIWPQLAKEVKSYVTSCLTCQTTKSISQKPIGLLSPLPIPPHRFHTFSLDFIGPFPPSGPDNHNAVLVVVEKITKLVTLIPTYTTATAADTATLFFKHIVCTGMGVPQVLISDRDSKFTSSFWRSLWSLLGCKFNMSSAFHPSTDGQTEVTNKKVKEIIRAFIDQSQTNWQPLLPYISFAINNSINSTTKHSPFFLTYLQHPHLPTALLQPSIPPSIGNNNVIPFVEQMQNTINKVKMQIAKAQQSQSLNFNKQHRPLTFQLHQKVLLDSSDIKTDKGLNTKLSDKFIGPYTITKVISPVSYQLQLPPHFRIHNTFHISKLRPYIPSSSSTREQNTRPEPEINESGQETWEVESIIKHKIIKQKNKMIKLVLVKWKNYPESENTWEPYSSIKQQVPDIIAAYEQK